MDGIAPTVTVGGETRTYVPPGRQFNVVFYFSEKVYGITDAEIKVTNGLAVDVKATSGNCRVAQVHSLGRDHPARKRRGRWP